MKRLFIAASACALALSSAPTFAAAQQPAATRDAASQLHNDLAAALTRTLSVSKLTGDPLQQALETSLEETIVASGLEPGIVLNALEGLDSPSAEANAAVRAVRNRILKLLANPLRPRSFGGSLSLPGSDLGPSGAGGGSDYSRP